jgi:hypothetical protein
MTASEENDLAMVTVGANSAAQVKCSPMELCKPTISLRLDSAPRYPLSFPFGAHQHRGEGADVEAGRR